jgi:hypothetical protein
MIDIKSSVAFPIKGNDSTHKIDKIRCMARKNQTWGFNIQCSYKSKVGNDYCGRHLNYDEQRKYRIDKCEEINTIKNEETNKTPPKIQCVLRLITVQDYLLDSTLINFNIKSIKFSCKIYNIKSSSKSSLENSKNNLLHILSKFLKTYLTCIIEEDKVKKVQKQIRYWINNSKIKVQGPAINNPKICNNETDFYSFDKLEDIPKKYFFSFKCKDNFIYGFHIESLIYLINDGGISSTTRNPYNRNIINKLSIEKAINLWNTLKKDKDNKEVANYIKIEESDDIKIRVRSKCLTTFQKMDFYGYHTDINWILNLSLNRLRYLYRSIANFWNYKAHLTQQLKIRIYPDGTLFTDREFLQINRQINKYVIMEEIINKIDKIVSSSNNDDDKNTGCILVLMAISDIVRECSIANAWLSS